MQATHVTFGPRWPSVFVLGVRIMGVQLSNEAFKLCKHVNFLWLPLIDLSDFSVSGTDRTVDVVRPSLVAGPQQRSKMIREVAQPGVGKS